jgi:excinuclease UvrABC nuclease subunit
VAESKHDLPCPPPSIQFDLPVGSPTLADLAPLPAKPGVLAIENQSGQTVFLAVTANLRQHAAAKLGLFQVGPRSSPRIRIDLNLVRRIAAVRVGSRFEGDWTYLQLARQRLPLTYRTLLDRWQAWFVRCDPTERFPQWTKTPHPSLAADPQAVFAGPLPEKHAAARYLDLLDDAFDLCRYHHILVQAPHGQACAYKEMGKCPAPCDGTVSLDSYRAQIMRSIAFADAPIEAFQAEVHASMNAASESRDFEQARRMKILLEATKPATRREFSMVGRIESFVIVSVQPSERKDWARLFLIRGGWIAPLADMRVDQRAEEFVAVVEAARSVATPREADFDESTMENLGMVCWHLFQPKTSKSRGEFMRIENLDAKSLRSAARRIAKIAETEDLADMTDQSLESVDSS